MNEQAGIAAVTVLCSDSAVMSVATQRVEAARTHTLGVHESCPLPAQEASQNTVNKRSLSAAKQLRLPRDSA